MFYDQYGRMMPTIKTTPPTAGVTIIPNPLSDRYALDVSRGLTPQYVDWIMTMANSGNIEHQCRLSRELPEKNHDVAHALRTRRNALCGCKWHIEPGDKTPQAAAIAQALAKELKHTGGKFPELGRINSFSRLIRDLTDALIPGFAASEIIWKPGGAGFFGFRPIEQRFFSFSKGFTPRLRTMSSMTDGIELPTAKIIFHELGENGPDPVRGGLIRPLAWLYCFSQIGLKDLLGFIERYGMPFVVAQVEQSTWEKEKDVLNNLISSFGPRGGGVFSKSVELKLLEATNSTADVYFKLLGYVGDAITKVILGQTASSGDSSGLSGGDAQSKVRQDILDADARAIEDTINCDLFAYWTLFNYGSAVASPTLVIETEQPKDVSALAQTVATLYAGGLQTDPAEMSKTFGMKLERRPEVAPMSPMGEQVFNPGNLELSEPVRPAKNQPPEKGKLLDALETWLNPLAKAAEAVAEASDEEFDEKLKKAAEASAGDTTLLEDLMANDMETAYGS